MGHATVSLLLSREIIAEGLVGSGVLDREVVARCELDDYRLFRCTVCELEFASPMQEPKNSFYREVTKHPKYYPKIRWEWAYCLDQLAQLANATKPLVLDVGCGDGQFLSVLKEREAAIGIGLDVTPSSIAACHSRGLNAIQGTFADVKHVVSNRIDVVTMWNVLEHVSDPVGLILEAKGSLALNGRIFFSLPLSPLSHEILVPDPLNLPPHHLTRWTIKSLRALAERVGMTVEFQFPASDSYVHRLSRSLLLPAVGPFNELTRGQKLIQLVRWVSVHPVLTLKAAYRQLHPARLESRVRPDLVLGSLRKC